MNRTFDEPETASALGSLADPVHAAREALLSTGAHIMPAAATNSVLGTTDGDWRRFRSQWNALCRDGFAAERGTVRFRRYGRFSFTTATGRFDRLESASFVQPENSNPLYIGVDRVFEPLTDAFVTDPVFGALLRLLGRFATVLDDPAHWTVQVHPFRVSAHAATTGSPAPEGRHRDGVTLVSSLLVGRDNAAGGESSVFTADGREVLTTTLREPGAALLGDDRSTLHDVSPVCPERPDRPAHRDVLVVTFAPWTDCR